MTNRIQSLISQSFGACIHVTLKSEHRSLKIPADLSSNKCLLHDLYTGRSRCLVARLSSVGENSLISSYGLFGDSWLLLQSIK